MKVAVYYNNNDIKIEDRPTPSISNNEILVQMKACGICGTDVMEWYRIRKAPRILGHEMAGEIVEIGRNVNGFRKGDRVFVSHHVPCYTCHFCTQGKYTACGSLHTGNYDPGGFAEFIRVPDENVKYGTFILPGDISYEDASIIEPLACVLAGQKQTGIYAGQTILILGSGVSGLLHLQLAKLKETRVIATDIDEFRLNKAAGFGADRAIDAKKYSVEMLRKINENRLADVVIVCAAADQAVEQAMKSVDKRGTILFFAVPQNTIPIPSLKFWRDEITVIFSYGASPDDIRESIQLIRGRKIHVREMITHSFPLSSITQGFQLVSAARESLKVVVVPDNKS
jgi:L-iditol 2-dehydrogenase